MRKTRRRAYRRKISAALCILLLVLATFTILLFVIPPIKIEAHEPVDFVTVIVEKGDSLWKIADRYDNNKMDLRKYIYVIEKYNNLDDRALQPGQRIILPVYE